MYHPTTILSSNTKTSCSINFPIQGHCRPTKNCARTCYARLGHTARPSNIKKQKWVSDYLKNSNLSEITYEIQKKNWPAIRLSATGDINPEHCPNILRLARACPGTMFWGMTRKIQIANALNNKLDNLKLMVSVDSSSPDSIWDYKGILCWGPRFQTDLVIPKRIHVIFPYHAHGKVVQARTMPRDPRDCRAVFHEISGCLECGRCWNW